jgi:hypothetical protein
VRLYRASLRASAVDAKLLRSVDALQLRTLLVSAGRHYDFVLAVACAAWAAEHAPMGRLGMWLGPEAYVGE